MTVEPEGVFFLCHCAPTAQPAHSEPLVCQSGHLGLSAAASNGERGPFQNRRDQEDGLRRQFELTGK